MTRTAIRQQQKAAPRPSETGRFMSRLGAGLILLGLGNGSRRPTRAFAALMGVVGLPDRDRHLVGRCSCWNVARVGTMLDLFVVAAVALAGPMGLCFDRGRRDGH